MASNLKWNGDAVQKQFKLLMERRIKAACIYLSKEVKADISQPGTLRYNPTLKSGKSSRSQKTIYNFTHSRPGNPPYKQTGQLRRAVGYETFSGTLTGRVGVDLSMASYAKALELGTRRMAARPFLRSNLIRHAGTIRAIIGGTIKPGEINVTSNQSRSGHFGAGAAQAGYE
jgi:hypothetical protein